MADLASLLPYVQDDVPAAPREVAMRALRRAARDLLTFSTIWREVLPAINAIVDEPLLPLTTPLGADAVALYRAWWGKRPLEVISLAKATDLTLLNVSASEPTAVTLLEPRMLQFAPAPQTAGTVTTLVALANLRDSNTVPDFVAERFGEAIADGAKHYLCLMPNRPWTSGDNALLFQSRYRAGSSTARREAETTFNAQDSQVHLRKWV